MLCRLVLAVSIISAILLASSAGSGVAVASAGIGLCGPYASTKPQRSAALGNWVGQSTWQFESDPAAPGRQQVVLTYPHLYTHGFDHKMGNHPIGRQVWRWDDSVERFVLVEKSVDTSQSAYGAQMPATLADRLRWLTNEGETAFRAGRYEEALSAYDEALALAETEGWRPAADEPDWVGVLRFRRGETLAHLGRASAAVGALEEVASDYEGGLLGDLTTAFLAAYGDGSAPDAAERGCAALQQLRDRVEDHFYYEREGALRFPMTATGSSSASPILLRSRRPMRRPGRASAHLGALRRGECKEGNGPNNQVEAKT